MWQVVFLLHSRRRTFLFSGFFLLFSIFANCWYVYYCLHPKDDGRLYFQSVHTCRGVPHLRSRYPISGLGRGATPSQVGIGGYLISGLARYPISGLGGYPGQVLMVGVPHPGGGGYPIQVLMVGGRLPTIKT